MVSFFLLMIEHLEGDCRDILPTLPAKSIQCAVTSPPYFGLRSYLPADHPAKSREIGQERTVQEYIETLVAVFAQVSRVLMNDGTLWLNLGDTYAKSSTKSSRRAGVKPGELIGVPWNYGAMRIMLSCSISTGRCPRILAIFAT